MTPSAVTAVYLAAKHAATMVAVTLTICDQDTEDPQHVAYSFENSVATNGMGFPTFLSVEELRSRPSYLTGDTLVIRADVHILL